MPVIVIVPPAYDKIPSEHMRETFRAWIERGRMGGGFFEALVSGDVTGALDHADEINRANFDALRNWLHWEAPAVCWGSREKVRAWEERGGVQGMADDATPKAEA